MPTESRRQPHTQQLLARGPLPGPRREPAAHLPADAAPALRLVRRVCLVRPLRGELALVSELVRHLAVEMPEIDFHLRPGASVEVVWITGARGHNAPDVARLRGGYPHALLVVTGRGLEGGDAERLSAAGADRVLGWPVPVAVLRAALATAVHGA